MKRQKVVLYNPRAPFYTMPLALLAVGSRLDPAKYEVCVIDGRLESEPIDAVLRELSQGQVLCLGMTVLTGAPITLFRGRRVMSGQVRHTGRLFGSLSQKSFGQ